jgi:transposase
MSNQEQYWLQHLAAIEREGISIKAYAERERISAWSLYDRRRKFKVDSGSSRPGAGSFVAVQVPIAEPRMPCSLKLGDRLELECSGLPSPAWLAALYAAMPPQVR